MTHVSKALACAIALATLAVSFSARAAGGHHAVDDATVPDAGECELETWATRARGGARLLHGGLNCGVAGLELGGAAEYARDGGTSQTGWALQAKAAAPVGESLSVGASLQASWQTQVDPRRAGSTLLLMATWTAREDLAVHVNFGRDFINQDGDLPRGGLGLEWSATAQWALVAERYREHGTHFVRGGLRWLPMDGWQVDLSRSRALRGVEPGAWTVGVAYAWR